MLCEKNNLRSERTFKTPCKATQDTKESQVPQERQVTEAIQDTKVSQVPEARQVTEVG